MAFRLSRRESPTAGARRLGDDELGAAIDRLRGDDGTPDQRVHAARKSIKRVRALLRLLRASTRKAAFTAANVALRDAARGLSAARDAAVAVATFDLLAPEPDADLAVVRDDLVARTVDADAVPDRATLALAADALDALRPRLAGDLGALDEATLTAGLTDSYAGGRAAMRAARARPDDEALHAWRKRAKDLWYQCQLLQGICPPQLDALAQMLAELGELLGADHDLAVLQAATPASHELHRRLAARHEELRRAAWQLGRRTYAERPAAFVRRMRAYWRVWCDEAT